MKLASVEKIWSVINHPNADALDIVSVLGYKAIVKRDQYRIGDFVIFIQPDTVLPDADWSTFYKSKSSRVRAIKLRGEWSMGIVENLSILTEISVDLHEGLEVSHLLGVTKYEPPAPNDLSAKGLLPFGIPKTDEERYQNIDVPYGSICDVTLKIDGQSWTAYCKLQEDGTVSRGICGRTLEFKEGTTNNYTALEKKYSILDKLEAFCRSHGVSLAIRGESYGSGIQNFKGNPHASKNKDLGIFSVYLIDEHRYARKGEEFYFVSVAGALGVPTVNILEYSVEVTPELIKKYDEDLKLVNGHPFEGVVLNLVDSPIRSFKIINKHYDSLK
jgi:RNA ligase (TIGR02306 family)